MAKPRLVLAKNLLRLFREPLPSLFQNLWVTPCLFEVTQRSLHHRLAPHQHPCLVIPVPTCPLPDGGTGNVGRTDVCTLFIDSVRWLSCHHWFKLVGRFCGIVCHFDDILAKCSGNFADRSLCQVVSTRQPTAHLHAIIRLSPCQQFLCQYLHPLLCDWLF